MREQDAAAIAMLVKKTVTPLQERLAIAEALLASVEARMRGDSFTKELGDLRERVAVVEVKAMQPGPPGEPGAPGKDGADGKPGLTYQGVFVDGKRYDVGELVTWGGSAWHCNEPTETKPGDASKAWTLMVKRGRDSK